MDTDTKLLLAVQQLEECLDWFDDRSDADFVQDHFIGNAEMQIASEIKDTLEAIRTGRAVSAVRYINAAQPVNPKV